MKTKYLKSSIIFIMGGFLLLGIQTQPTAQQVPGNYGQGQSKAMNNKKNESKAKYAPGRFIVKFKSEGPNAVTGDAQSLLESNQLFQAAVADGLDSLDKLNQKHKVKNAKSLFVERHGLTTADARQKQNNSQQSSKAMHQSRNQRAPKDAVIPDLSNIYVLDVAPESDIEQIVQEYQSDPHVEYAQPDYLMETNMVPNDPYYSSSGSWGQTYDDLWGLKNIKAEQAWDITQGEGVVVAVVDTGLDYNHPDIAANVWTNPGEIPNNGIDDDGNGFVDDVRGWDFIGHDVYYPAPDNDPMDGHGHGTHVSGTIAAVGNNNLGIIGVAPKAKIMPLKGLDDTGMGYISDLSNGIVYAAQNGADVINNSWGCGGGCPSNPVAEDAVRTAYGLGVVVVFAAGNDSADVSNYSPQNMTDPKPIVTASIDHMEKRSIFSNYGTLIDVAAPGGDGLEGDGNNGQGRNILSLRAKDTDMYGDSLCIVGDNYYRSRGTSMAAPHVAGVAALILASHPSFTNEDVRHALRLAADDVGGFGFDLQTGAGRINAARAVAIPSVSAIETGIASPAYQATINYKDGAVPIVGTASGPDFKQYEVFYGYGDAPSSWVSLGAPSTIPAQNVAIGIWMISELPVGTYLIRLLVTSQNDQEFEEVVQVFLEPSVTPVTASDLVDQNTLDISGERVIGQDNRDNTNNMNIYLYDLAARTERRITGPEAFVYTSLPFSAGRDFPQISGDLIVWLDNRNFQFPFQSASADIYLYDLTTNTERRITTDLDTPTELGISGDRIVWIDKNMNPGDIYFCQYDRIRGTCPKERLAVGASPKYSVAISGDRIIWQDYRNSSCDIYLYDLTTNTERRITADLAIPIFRMAISGDRIAWDDSRNWYPSLWDIYLYDLSTNTERRITSEAGASYQSSPSISGDLMVWGDNRNGNEDIYLYDLVTNTEQQVTAHPAFQLTPTISGNRIVWIDGRDGQNWEIYTTGLPTIDPIGQKPAAEGSLLKFTVKATDPDGDTLNLTATGLVSGTSFEKVVQSALGVIEKEFSWVPGYDQAGSYNVSFRVTGGGLFDTETITITVVDVPVPDLLLTALSKTTGPVAPGGGFGVSNTVANQGNASAGTFAVGFVLSGDAVYGGMDDIVLTAARSVTSLAAGATSAASTTLTVPSATAFGNYYVCAMADKDDSVTESSETNNSRCTATPIQVASADLVMTAVSGPSSAVTGTTITISNTVKNQGTAPAGGFYVSLYGSPDASITTADTRISTRYVSSLSAGTANSANTAVTISANLVPATYYIGAIADCSNAVVENIEANNAFTGNTVVLTIGADLVMTAVSGPTSGTKGTSIGISNTVKNQGTGSASSFTVGLYLSTDATITTTDLRIGTRNVSSLVVGVSSSTTTTLTIPATLAAGTYYIGAVADYTNMAKENNETNNARAGNTIVIQ